MHIRSIDLRGFCVVGRREARSGKVRLRFGDKLVPRYVRNLNFAPHKASRTAPRPPPQRTACSLFLFLSSLLAAAISLSLCPSRDHFSARTSSLTRSSLTHTLSSSASCVRACAVPCVVALEAPLSFPLSSRTWWLCFVRALPCTHLSASLPRSLSPSRSNSTNGYPTGERS